MSADRGDPLYAVRQAARLHADTKFRLEYAIKVAHVDGGQSLRAIAAAVGLSPETVRKIALR